MEESGGSLLVVDDDLSVRQFLTIMLERGGHEVMAAASGMDAFQLMERHEFHLVITDMKMPKVSGMDVLRHVKQVSPHTAVVVITAYATTDSAVEAMKQGAFDYVIKPFKIDELKLVVSKALEQRRLAQENVLLRKQLKATGRYQNIIGSSPAMQRIFELIDRVKDTHINVLLTGESGTGKEMVARAIHFSGARANEPFLGINCSAIPETLIESELFGHKKGAFTGAISNKKGLFEAAAAGTLFLDEIGELPVSTQVKLLRALQERRIKAVGGLEEVEVNARIIAATNLDLEREVAEGRFREDLFYRLNVVPIRLPALRERREDVPALIAHFQQKYTVEYAVERKDLSGTSVRALLSYDYPGNVRELENLVERCVALGSEDIALGTLLEQFPAPGVVPAGVPTLFAVGDLPVEGESLDSYLEGLERSLIAEALARTSGRKKEAAKLLGITFRSFRYRLGKHEDLDPNVDD
jgi:two-component system, NtrC family, response regulator PilR